MVALGMVYGLLLVVAGACANGVFTVPLKFINGWEWENAWLIYSLVGTLILPWALVGITIPDLVEVYSAAHWVEVAMCAGFGLGWGFGGVIFGICVDLIGNALTFSLVLGLTSCIGSLAPFIINGGDLHSTEALLNYTALGFVLVGLCFITVAGVFKDKQQSAALRTLEEAMGTGENLSLSARQELRAIFDETTGLTRKLAAMSSSTMPLSATAVSAVVDEALGLLRQAADVSVALDDSNQSGISERYSYGLADDYAPDIGVGGARSGVLSYSDSSANRASPLLKSSQLSVWGRDDSGDDTAFNRSPRASDLSVRSARGGGGDGGGTRGGGCCSGAAGKSAFGIVLAIIGGILSPCINFPLAFVHSIPNTARAHGASKVMAPNTVWALALAFGMLPNVGYTLFLLCKNGTWRLFCRAVAPRRFAAHGSPSALVTRDLLNLFFSAMMGLLWFGSNILYSIGAEMIGKQGPVVGFAVFICGMILVANIFGFIMREWHHTEWWTKLLQCIGLLFTLGAIVTLALAGYFGAKEADAAAAASPKSSFLLGRPGYFFI